MSNNFEYLNSVQKGRTDWRIKVRIIREWRGKDQAGNLLKGYNILLLDAKNVRMQAFVPSYLSDKMQKMFTVEKMYIISNFQVKDYTEIDKWRCVNMDRQIIFTTNTRALEIQENQYFIAKNMFDFFEFTELESLASQNLYLADVVGVVIKKGNIKMVRNSKTGRDQTQLRMQMTDGRSRINVILWDEMAEEFEDEINTKAFQEPLILIIASGRVGKWKDELDICNFSPTAYYINYNHHSVAQLRKMIAETNFMEENYSVTQPKKPLAMYTVQQIKNLPEDYTQEQVICQVKIIHVEESETWYYTICTSCYYQVHIIEDNHFCTRCNRIVPEPDKKFGIIVHAVDATGDIEIILMDRPIRTIFQKNVVDMEEEKGAFPSVMKQLENGDYTIKLQILQVNIKDKKETYLATDIFPGFQFTENTLDETTRQQPTERSVAESSGVSFHLDNMSQMK